jgi:uncharacterized membrane protein
MVAAEIKLPVQKSRYFLPAAFIALGVVLIGFWKTFVVPSFQGTFTAPPIIYIHGALLFLWTLFLLTQSILIRQKNLRLHRKLGWVGPALAIAVAISTIAAGVYVLRRDVAAGGGRVAVSSFLGVLSTPVIFTALVMAGVIYRKRPEVHKRLMLLAMISVLWAAFGRFRHYFPPFEQSLLVFQGILPLSMILIVMLWEKLAKGRIHAVYYFVGLPLLVESLAEIYFFDSTGWQTVSGWIAGYFL